MAAQHDLRVNRGRGPVLCLDGPPPLGVLLEEHTARGRVDVPAHSLGVLDARQEGGCVLLAREDAAALPTVRGAEPSPPFAALLPLNASH